MVELHGSSSRCEEHSEVPVEEKNTYIPHQKGCNELTILERLPMLSCGVSVRIPWPAHNQPILHVHVAGTELTVNFHPHEP